ELPGWAAAEREAPNPEAARRARDYHPFSTLLAWRWVFERVGPFDTTLEAGEEIDFIFRAREAGIEIETLDEGVIPRRVHGRNHTYKRSLVRDGMFRAFKARIDRGRAARAASERTPRPRR